MQKERFDYIDALRGLAMLLVVYSHIALFSYIDIKTPFVVKVGRTFMVPLFFFISGFVLYKSNFNWTINTVVHFIKDKILRIGIPTTFFILIFNTVYGHGGISHYWFLIALFEFYILYSMYAYLTNQFREQIWSLYFVLLLSFCAFGPLDIIQEKIGIESISFLIKKSQHFFYFTLGIVVRIRHNKFNQICLNKYFTFLFILIYIGAFFTDINISSTTLLLKKYKDLFQGTLGIFLIYSFFYRYQYFFQKNLGKSIVNTGKHTLAIYLIHYFLIPYESKYLTNIALQGEGNRIINISYSGQLNFYYINFN